MISPTIRANIFVIVAAYRKATGYSLATVSNKFYGNANFLNDLRRPKNDPKRKTVSIDKLDDMVEKFEKEWPDGVPFPVLRPSIMGRRGF